MELLSSWVKSLIAEGISQFLIHKYGLRTDIFIKDFKIIDIGETGTARMHVDMTIDADKKDIQDFIFKERK